MRIRIAGTRALQELFSPEQLAVVFANQEEIGWLGGNITQKREPELYKYLRGQLGVPQVEQGTIIGKLEKSFLEAQKDAWIEELYGFLAGANLNYCLNGVPLIRLEDGSHVECLANSTPRVYLPGPKKTAFLTVRASVCESKKALKFLQSLGLKRPDPVDEIVETILPKYRQDKLVGPDSEYEADITQMLEAFDTDSTKQRERLQAALSGTAFEKAVTAESGEQRLAKPAEVYLAVQTGRKGNRLDRADR